MRLPGWWSNLPSTDPGCPASPSWSASPRTSTATSAPTAPPDKYFHQNYKSNYKKFTLQQL